MKDFIKQFIEAHFNAEFDNIDKSAKVVITLSDLIERDKNMIEKILNGVQKYIDMHTSTPTPLNNTHTREEGVNNTNWLTKKEVEKLLRVKQTTIWRWEKAQLLTPRKIGRKNLYNRAEIEKLLESRRI